MAADAGLVITAQDVLSHELWTFRPGDGGMGCPTVEKIWTGDGPVTWTYTYRAGVDRMPGRHAIVTLELPDGTIVQTGRLVRKGPPDSSLCEGPCTLTTEGYIASLSDQKIPGVSSVTDPQGNPTPEHFSAIFGPTWQGSPLATTPEDSIRYAVRYAPNVGIFDALIASTGFVLTDTEDYFARAPMDVVNAMTAMAAGFATPFAPAVRKGVFSWGPIDLTPQYQVSIADGAVVTPSDDASRLYSRVWVLWGNGQLAIYPDEVAYDQIPTIVDLVVNAGTEVRSKGAALQLAQGIYGRLRFLELGWSCTINIPEGTPIIANDGGSWTEINPLLVPTQAMIRVPDLADHYKDEGIPNNHLITQATWSGDEKGTGLTLRCGEMRDPRALIRQTMSTGSRAVAAIQQPGLSQPTRDANKTKLLGPPLPEAPTPTKPAPIDHAIPAVATEKNQTLITNEASKPITVEKGHQGEDVITAGLLDTAIYRTHMPPCEIESVFFSGTPAGTATIEVWTAKRAASSDGRGDWLTDASGELIPDLKVFSASLAGTKIYQHRYKGTTLDPRPRVTNEAMFVYKITGTPTVVTSWQLTFIANRIAVGHPAGHDTAASLGARSA